MGNLKEFRNLTNFCQSMAFKPDYTLFVGVRFLGASRMLSRDWSEQREHRDKQSKVEQAEQSAVEQMSEQVEQSK